MEWENVVKSFLWCEIYNEVEMVRSDRVNKKTKRKFFIFLF